MSVKPPTASLASKLSRNRKAESSKPVSKILNESADDFVNEPPVKKVEKKKSEKVSSKKSASVEVPTILVPTCEAFLKCPFCGKSFSAGQELKR